MPEPNVVLVGERLRTVVAEDPPANDPFPLFHHFAAQLDALRKLITEPDPAELVHASMLGIFTSHRYAFDDPRALHLVRTLPEGKVFLGVLKGILDRYFEDNGGPGMSTFTEVAANISSISLQCWPAAFSIPADLEEALERYPPPPSPSPSPPPPRPPASYTRKRKRPVSDEVEVLIARSPPSPPKSRFKKRPSTPIINAEEALESDEANKGPTPDPASRPRLPHEFSDNTDDDEPVSAAQFDELEGEESEVELPRRSRSKGKQRARSSDIDLDVEEDEAPPSEPPVRPGKPPGVRLSAAELAAITAPPASPKSRTPSRVQPKRSSKRRRTGEAFEDVAPEDPPVGQPDGDYKEEKPKNKGKGTGKGKRRGKTPGTARILPAVGQDPYGLHPSAAVRRDESRVGPGGLRHLDTLMRELFPPPRTFTDPHAYLLLEAPPALDPPSLQRDPCVACSTNPAECVPEAGDEKCAPCVKRHSPCSWSLRAPLSGVMLDALRTNALQYRHGQRSSEHIDFVVELMQTTHFAMDELMSQEASIHHQFARQRGLYERLRLYLVDLLAYTASTEPEIARALAPPFMVSQALSLSSGQRRPFDIIAEERGPSFAPQEGTSADRGSHEGGGRGSRGAAPNSPGSNFAGPSGSS